MVARGEAPYRSANAGELSPDAAGRADIKQFYSAGLRFKDIEPVPLSGFRRMAGSFDLGAVRGQLESQAGSVSHHDFFAGPYSGSQLCVEDAFSAPRLVSLVHIPAFSLSAGTAVLRLQVKVNGAWVDFGKTLMADTVARSKTFAVAPGTQMLATGVRLLLELSGAATVTLSSLTSYGETATRNAPRYASLRHDSGDRYFFALQQQSLDVWKDDAFVGSVFVEGVTAAMLPGVNFYAEGGTLGIAHQTLKTLRIRRSGSAYDWAVDDWPYEGVPTTDLGGSYAKTDDVWQVDITWTGTPLAYLQITVDGEATPALPFVTSGGAPVAIGTADLPTTAASIKAALEALPSLGATVTVALTNVSATAHKAVITFGGALSGVERQVSTLVTNTAAVAALAGHTQVGKTDFEDLISVSRGWPGVFGFAQDRLQYGDIPAVPPAIMTSAAGEYFNVNIDAAGAAAARLDKLRGGNVLERVLAFAENVYALVFTDKAVHFASNRTISAEEPLNFVRTATSGTVPNCKPVDLEGKTYFVGVNPKTEPPTGHQILSLSYSEIDTRFEAVPEHLLATHLVEGVIRSDGQVAASKADAARMWLLREDGRVIVASVIQSQEVLGFHEWRLPDGWAARELHVDGNNDVRLCVEFDGRLRHHRLDRACLLKGAIAGLCDLGGVMDGLDIYEDRVVWAQTADGFVLGPFTVSGGAIDLGDAFTGTVLAGPWLAPVWESMPRYFIARNDEVIQRPGRVHTVNANVLETTSIAIGANGSRPETVPLLDPDDDQSLAPQPKSRLVKRFGIPGHKNGTTVVVTQNFPGELHVRDMTLGEAL